MMEHDFVSELLFWVTSLTVFSAVVYRKFFNMTLIFTKIWYFIPLRFGILFHNESIFTLEHRTF
jgi:hypothetical protein